MHRMFLLLFFIFFTSTSYADCQKLLTDLAQKLHPNATLGPPDQSTCKVWIYSPDKTPVILTLLSDIPDQDPDNPTYDINVMIVNSNTGKIISHLYETQAFSDDAIFTESITIDTARFQLNSTTRAFGIRFHQRNHAKYNNYSGEVLNLYYLQDKKIQLAVKGLSMDESFGEWEEDCKGEFKDIKRTIVIEKEQQNGLNNLRVNEILTNSTLKLLKTNECEPIIKNNKKKNLILKYNGSEYSVPKKYRGYGF